MGWQIKKSFAYPERLEPVPNGPGVQRIVGHATRNANARDGNTWWEDISAGDALQADTAGAMVRHVYGNPTAPTIVCIVC